MNRTHAYITVAFTAICVGLGAACIKGIQIIDDFADLLDEVEQESPQIRKTVLLDCPECGLPAEIEYSAFYRNRYNELTIIRQLINCSAGEHPPILVEIGSPDDLGSAETE